MNQLFDWVFGLLFGWIPALILALVETLKNGPGVDGEE